MIMEFDDLILDMIEDEATKDTTKNLPSTPEEPPIEGTEETQEEKSLEEDLIEDKDTNTNVGDEDEAKAVAEVSFGLLKEYGIVNLPDDFNFDGTPEAFEKALELSKENLKEEAAKNLWETLPEDFKPLLQYALSGGKDLQSFIETYTQPDYSNIDLSSPDNQRQVMYDYWALTSNYSPEKINRMIDALDKAGDLESEALETAQELQEIIEERKQKLIEEAALEEENQKKRIQEQTEKIVNIIDNLPNVEKARKSRLQSFMFTPVKYEEGYSTGLNRTIQQITSNPEHFVQLADLLADYNPNKGFSFERIKAQVETQKNKNFKDIIDKLESKSKIKGTPSKQIKEDFD